MSYTSLEFALLLIMTFAAYSVWPRMRFLVLLLSSLVFYMWAGLFDFCIFMLVILVSYLAVFLAERVPRYRRGFIFAGVGVLLAHLFVWKYLPWISGLWGRHLELPLPLGIS